MCECAKSLRCKYHRKILVFFKRMCTIQLNYAYSREREHDVYIETTSLNKLYLLIVGISFRK